VLLVAKNYLAEHIRKVLTMAISDRSEASDTDAATAPAPPNLRAAADESKECGNCVFYDNVHCTKFPPLCVSDEWVCDAWKAGGKDTDEGPPAHNVRQAGRNALTRLRASATNARSQPQPR
jgi:hypothetical protein